MAINDSGVLLKIVDTYSVPNTQQRTILNTQQCTVPNTQHIVSNILLRGRLISE